MTSVGSRLGVGARPEGGGVDFDRLRADRRRRVFDAMAAADLDALVLGRPANVAFVSGARQLWTAGARPFGPTCVVVAGTARVHLLSVWDEGVPPEIEHADLYGLSWNPANLLRSLSGISGLQAARRVGTDGLSPGFPQFLAAAAPSAEIVDATTALRSVRDVKSADEIACIATAAAIAESALATMMSALRPGVSERELVARYVEHISRLGAPTPPSEAAVSVTPRRGRVDPPGVASSRTAAGGDLVVLDPGAMYAGYEAGMGRTSLVPGGHQRSRQAELLERARRQLAAVVASCRPGATGADVRAAWADAGGTLAPMPIVHGLGLGAEAPVVTSMLGSDEVLRAGMVVSAQVWVTEEGIGGCLERDTVLVDDGGPVALTRSARDSAMSSS